MSEEEEQSEKHDVSPTTLEMRTQIDSLNEQVKELKTELADVKAHCIMKEDIKETSEESEETEQSETKPEGNEETPTESNQE